MELVVDIMDGMHTFNKARFTEGGGVEDVARTLVSMLRHGSYKECGCGLISFAMYWYLLFPELHL